MSKREIDVSVVIPAYNAGTFLARAIECVLAQTVRPREIIVVDDGSADNTSEVARSFVPQIVFMHQNNSGPSVARNRGIEAATSTWIAFLDADDLWLPEKLEHQWDLLQAEPDLAWCCTAIKDVFSDGQEKIPSPELWEKLPTTQGQTQAFLESWAAGVPLSTCGMLIRRDVFDTVGLFPTDLRRGEDLNLWYRIAFSHPRIGYIGAPEVVYLHREESLTGSAGDSTHRDMAAIERNLGMLEGLPEDVAESFLGAIRKLAEELLLHSLNMARPDRLRELHSRYAWLLTPRSRQLARLGSVTPRILLRLLSATRRLAMRILPRH